MILIAAIDGRIVLAFVSVVIGVGITYWLGRSELRQWQEFIPQFVESKNLEELSIASPRVVDDMVYYLNTLNQRDLATALSGLGEDSRQQLKSFCNSYRPSTVIRP